MTFLPIVERELRVAARLTRTYRSRALMAAILGIVAIIMLLFGALGPAPAQMGGTMFATLSWMVLGFCLLEGGRTTADCLSEERREGTLGLLFLTDLKGYDVVLGKLAATSLNSIYGLLAMLPILALPLLLGGVTMQEFWLRALALANILFASLAAGMWVSARSRVERAAVSGTFWLLLAWVVVPPLSQSTTLYGLSPGFAFAKAGYGGMDYWKSFLCTQLIGWFLLAWASYTVSRRLADNAAPAGRPFWLRGRGVRQRARASRNDRQRSQMLDINPAFWLVMRNVSPVNWIWFVIIPIATVLLTLSFSAVFGIGLLIPAGLLVNFLLKMRIGVQACHGMAEIRRDNGLEMLLSTPLTTHAIIRGQILALRRMFTAPIIAVVVSEIFGFVCLVSVFGQDPFDRLLGLGLGAIGLLAYFGVFALDILAVTWAGLWFGLASKNETKAAFKTIFYVLVAPNFVLPFCLFYGAPLFIAWPIVWAAVAKQKVETEMRRLAGPRFGLGANTAGWVSRQGPLPSLVGPGN